MKLSGALVLFSAALVFGQAQTCTQEMIASDDCAAVIDANACYNAFRWNAQTLQCIDGVDNADRQRKASRSRTRSFPYQRIMLRICHANNEIGIGVLVLQLCWHRHVQLGEIATIPMCGIREPVFGTSCLRAPVDWSYALRDGNSVNTTMVLVGVIQSTYQLNQPYPAYWL
ncbi:hypothetical protein F4777DRAFT_163658 [Nemania sp. FL0916]|nr:hypothetical protein F4777DRAFT_163658 [Nemania sp. FL0916]